MATTISGTSGVTFPAGGVGNPAGAVVGTTDTQTLTNKTLGSGLVAGASYLTSGTAVTLTTQTSVIFSTIPSWVKRVTFNFDGVSSSGSSQLFVRIGSASLENTGYKGVTFSLGQSVGNSVIQLGTEILLGDAASQTTANVHNGYIVFNLLGSNTWTFFGAWGRSDTTRLVQAMGSKIISGGALAQIQLSTVNGTDTFDAGSINILYE